MKRKPRQGFTLIEVTVSSVIMTFMMMTLLMLFILSQRLVKETLIDTELVLTARRVRDKLFFRLNGMTAEKSFGLINAPGLESINGSVLQCYENYETYQRRQSCQTLTMRTQGLLSTLNLPQSYLQLPGSIMMSNPSTCFSMEDTDAYLTLKMILSSENSTLTQVMRIPCFGKLID